MVMCRGRIIRLGRPFSQVFSVRKRGFWRCCLTWMSRPYITLSISTLPSMDSLTRMAIRSSLRKFRCCIVSQDLLIDPPHLDMENTNYSGNAGPFWAIAALTRDLPCVASLPIS